MGICVCYILITCLFYHALKYITSYYLILFLYDAVVDISFTRWLHQHMAFSEIHKNFLGWQQCQVVQENKCIIKQTLSPSSSVWYTRIPIITSVNMVPETDSDFFIKQFVLIYHNHARGDGIGLWYTSLTKPLTMLAAQQDISDILKTHKLT